MPAPLKMGAGRPVQLSGATAAEPCCVQCHSGAAREELRAAERRSRAVATVAIEPETKLNNPAQRMNRPSGRTESDEMNTNHCANQSAVTVPTGPTAREVLPTIGVSVAVSGAVIVVHWIATVLQ